MISHMLSYRRCWNRQGLHTTALSELHVYKAMLWKQFISMLPHNPFHSWMECSAAVGSVAAVQHSMYYN